MQEDTTDRNEFLIEETIENNTSSEKKSSLLKTSLQVAKKQFHKNIFISMITTTGSALFYLPYQAKQSGLLLTSFLIIFLWIFSFYFSSFIYKAFSESTEKHYYQKFFQNFNFKLIFISHLIVFLHNFCSVVVTWIFSFLYIKSSIEELFLKSNQFLDIFFFLTFSVFIFLILFMTTFLEKIKVLRKILILQFLILIYLMVTFAILLPSYFSYYKPEIKIIGFEFDYTFFTTFGICLFLFLNEYNLLAICNKSQEIISKTIFKNNKLTNACLLIFYLSMIFIGYFSQPNNITNKLFLNRDIIPDVANQFVLVGKILFSLSLLISLVLKTHFYILYFHQILENLKNNQYSPPKAQATNLIKKSQISGKNFRLRNNSTIEGNKMHQGNNIDIEKSNSLLKESNKNAENRKSDLSENKRLYYNTFVSEKSENFLHFNNTKEEFQNEDYLLRLSKIKSLKNIIETKSFKFYSESDIMLNDNKKCISQHYFINFFLLFFTSGLVILISFCLQVFIALSGIILGFFELGLFPFIITLYLHLNNKLFKKLHLISAILLFSLFFILCLFSFFVILIYN